MGSSKRSKSANNRSNGNNRYCDDNIPLTLQQSCKMCISCIFKETSKMLNQNGYPSLEALICKNCLCGIDRMATESASLLCQCENKMPRNVEQPFDNENNIEKETNSTYDNQSTSMTIKIKNKESAPGKPGEIETHLHFCSGKSPQPQVGDDDRQSGRVNVEGGEIGRANTSNEQKYQTGMTDKECSGQYENTNVKRNQSMATNYGSRPVARRPSEMDTHWDYLGSPEIKAQNGILNVKKCRSNNIRFVEHEKLNEKEVQQQCSEDGAMNRICPKKRQTISKVIIPQGESCIEIEISENSCRENSAQPQMLEAEKQNEQRQQKNQSTYTLNGEYAENEPENEYEQKQQRDKGVYAFNDELDGKETENQYEQKQQTPQSVYTLNGKLGENETGNTISRKNSKRQQNSKPKKREKKNKSHNSPVASPTQKTITIGYQNKTRSDSSGGQRCGPSESVQSLQRWAIKVVPSGVNQQVKCTDSCCSCSEKNINIYIQNGDNRDHNDLKSKISCGETYDECAKNTRPEYNATKGRSPKTDFNFETNKYHTLFNPNKYDYCASPRGYAYNCIPRNICCPMQRNYMYDYNYSRPEHDIQRHRYTDGNRRNRTRSSSAHRKQSYEHPKSNYYSNCIHPSTSRPIMGDRALSYDPCQSWDHYDDRQYS